jgi:hypothetical protein
LIIKTGGIKSGDGARICSYATRQADNERVHIIENNAEELLIADEFAELRGRKNGLLHIIISPSQKLTGDELKITVKAINAEFGFNPKDPVTLAVYFSSFAAKSLVTECFKGCIAQPACDQCENKIQQNCTNNPKISGPRSIRHQLTIFGCAQRATIA